MNIRLRSFGFITALAAAVTGCASQSTAPDDTTNASPVEDANPTPPSGDPNVPNTDTPIPATGPVIDSPEKFQDLNGVMWLYTTEHAIKFNDIKAKLDDYKSRGIRILGIYSPYNGNVDKWLGCAPLDYYATAPQSGTLDDFKDLVRTAHLKGMKIVTYFVNIYIDKDSSFFKKAEAQYKAGDRTSREVSAVHWSDNDKDALPTPSAGPACDDPELDPDDKDLCTKWRYSDTAGAFYWSLWGEVGFDYNVQGARTEVERATKFWLDTGIDGFMFDAAYVDPKFKALMTEMPKAYTNNEKWITFESAASEDQTKLDAFGLTSWFNAYDEDTDNNYTYVTRGSDSADDLEDSFKALDFAREHGKTTFGWSILEGNYGTHEAEMRSQEAALMAGAGMIYGAPGETDTFSDWPMPAQKAWEKVLVTINANKALLPSASRKRVKAGADGKVYAMTRTSTDGTQSALLVYNLKSTPSTIPLDLTGTGIGLAQTPKDLHGAKAMPAINSATYSLDLPAYGFEILEVTKQ